MRRLLVWRTFTLLFNGLFILPSHDFLNAVIWKKSLQFLDIFDMLLIRQRRVINDGFIIKFHEWIYDIAGGVTVQFGFLGKNNSVYILDINALCGALGCDLWFKNFALFLISFTHIEALGLEVFENGVDAFGGVLHDNFEFEMLRGCDSFF